MKSVNRRKKNTTQKAISLLAGSPAAAVHAGNGECGPAPLARHGAREYRFISPSPEAFWNSLELYSKGLERLGKLNSALESARDILAGLGIGNLRLLAEEAHLVKPDDATDRTLAGFLLSEADAATIVHLREFLRRRSEAVDAVFLRVFRRKAAGFSTSVTELSPRHAEKLK